MTGSPPPELVQTAALSFLKEQEAARLTQPLAGPNTVCASLHSSTTPTVSIQEKRKYYVRMKACLHTVTAALYPTAKPQTTQHPSASNRGTRGLSLQEYHVATEENGPQTSTQVSLGNTAPKDRDQTHEATCCPARHIHRDRKLTTGGQGLGVRRGTGGGDSRRVRAFFLGR